MSNSNSKAGAEAQQCTEAEVTTSSSHNAKPNVSGSVIVDLALRHKKLMDKKNILISVYTNASGFLWSIMKVDSGTDLGGSEFNGDCKMSGSFTTYEKAFEDALNLVDKADLSKFQKQCPNNKFHWGNYAGWLCKHYR